MSAEKSLTDGFSALLRIFFISQEITFYDIKTIRKDRGVAKKMSLLKQVRFLAAVLFA